MFSFEIFQKRTHGVSTQIKKGNIISSPNTTSGHSLLLNLEGGWAVIDIIQSGDPDLFQYFKLCIKLSCMEHAQSVTLYILFPPFLCSEQCLIMEAVGQKCCHDLKAGGSQICIQNPHWFWEKSQCSLCCPQLLVSVTQALPSWAVPGYCFC